MERKWPMQKIRLMWLLMQVTSRHYSGQRRLEDENDELADQSIIKWRKMVNWTQALQTGGHVDQRMISPLWWMKWSHLNELMQRKQMDDAGTQRPVKPLVKSRTKRLNNELTEVTALFEITSLTKTEQTKMSYCGTRSGTSQVHEDLSTKETELGWLCRPWDDLTWCQPRHE